MKPELPLPSHYRPDRAADWSYRPDLSALLSTAVSWRRLHQVAPVGEDERTVNVLLIDMQKDFCLPEGTLFVAGRSGQGAIDDTRRTAEFLYRNAANISEITATLDTHHPHHIFFSSFWHDAEGQVPPPHQPISTADIDRGRLRPNPVLASWLCDGDEAWLLRQVRFYCAALERAGKYQLYLWPPHCILGSDGHALVGSIQEARVFHAYLRGARPPMAIKGEHALSENYSVFSPEVTERHDSADNPLAERNPALIQQLLRADALVIAGQAASHCVASSIDDLLDEIQRLDPALARKVYILTDCMSAVTVPDGKGGFHADFTPQAEAALARYADAGMHLVKSTDAMSGWPGWS